MLEVMSQAPDFTLPTDGGGSLTLSDLRGKNVVLYFYPKDDTQGCTKEACAFKEALAEFDALDTVIIGLSKDPVSKHDKFKAKYELPFTLVSDEEVSACEAYHVWVEKSMYGRKYMGIERATYLIDKDGTIRYIWRKVKVTNHVKQVLKETKVLVDSSAA